MLALEVVQGLQHLLLTLLARSHEHNSTTTHNLCHVGTFEQGHGLEEVVGMHSGAAGKPEEVVDADKGQ